MSGTTIREFMVALGFSTDNSGAKKMADSLLSVELQAKALNMALIGLATGAVAAVAKTASELDKLYYSSQRIGASASNIRGFEAALSQMGGTAANALQSLESLSQKIRQSPGYEGMVNNLGVSTRDQNGAMRDRVEVMKDMSKTLAGMEYYQANAYGSAMGIDETTLMAMRDPAFLQNMEKYQKLQKDMGMSDDMAKSGKDFMVQFRDITMTVKALSEVILMTAGKALIPVLKIINTGLQSAIQWFSGLNPATKEFLAMGLKIGMLTIVIGGLVAAGSKLIGMIGILKSVVGLFKLLRIAILGSPIGLILALAAAIGLLYDDYMTWKNGGKSLIDWGEWAGGIETAITRIKELAEVIMGLRDKAIELTTVGIEKTVNAAKTAATITQDVAKAGVAAVTDGAKALNSAMGGGSNAYGFSFGKEVDQYIKEASAKYGIPEDVLRGFVKMEAGWTGKMSPTGAIGTGQFIQSTWDNLAKTKEGKAIGMTKIGKRFRTAQDPRYDKRVNTLATGLLAQQNAEILKQYGLPITGENLYLAHNIGAENFAKAYTGQGASKKALKAMQQNGMKKGETPEQFVRRQAKIFQKHYRDANKPAVLSTPNLSMPPASINTIAPPSGNPHKEQLNAANGSGAKTVNIYQSHKTDMVINGADNPLLTANKVQQYNENTAVQMARNARTVIG